MQFQSSVESYQSSLNSPQISVGQANSQQTQPNPQLYKKTRQQKIAILINSIKQQLQKILQIQQINQPEVQEVPEVQEQKPIHIHIQVQKQKQKIQNTNTINPRYWQNLSKKFAQLIHRQTTYTPQTKTLITLIIKYFAKFPKYTAYLQYFDYIMVAIQGKIVREDYSLFIHQISQAILAYTLEQAQQGGAVGGKQCDVVCMEILDGLNLGDDAKKSQEGQLLLIENQRQLLGKQSVDIDKQLIQKWRIYMDLLRSYTYYCLQHKDKLTYQNWVYYITTLTLLLQTPRKLQSTLQPQHPHPPQPQPQPQQKHPNKQICHRILTLTQQLSKSKFYTKFYHNFFHQICMFLRVFICDTQQFLNIQDQNCNEVMGNFNYCELLMRFIENQFTNCQFVQTAEYKLDCLALLMTILSAKLPCSANYNQVLQFAFWIIIFSNQQQQKLPNINKNKNRNITNVGFYCGQLLCMIMHRNIEWVVQFCRKSQNKQKKYLKKLVKIYENVLIKIMQNIEKMQEQEYVYTRIILGYCALIRIQKMEDFVQKALNKMFPSIVRIIEIQYGWEQEQAQQQQKQRQQQKQKVLKTQDIEQQLYQQVQEPQPSTQKQQIQFEQIPKIQQPNPINPNSNQYKNTNINKPTQQPQQPPLIWNQQFYFKNKIKQFQNIDQIQIFKKSMLIARVNNPQLFQFFMNNFSEKQIMMWVVQLEKQDQLEEDSDSGSLQGDHSLGEKQGFKRYPVL